MQTLPERRGGGNISQLAYEVKDTLEPSGTTEGWGMGRPLWKPVWHFLKMSRYPVIPT